jgi:hypothetical protein
MTEITLTIWHNTRTDTEGRHLAMLDGYTPGDPMVRVFTYQAQPRGRTPEQIADRAYSAFNGYPLDDDDTTLARAYYQRQLRSLSAGDVVSVGDMLLAVARPAGWTRVPGVLTEARTDEHGTHPLLPDGPAPGPGSTPANAPQQRKARGNDAQRHHDGRGRAGDRHRR